MTAITHSPHEAALRLLESRRRTRRELERALARRFEAAEIAAALDRLESVGLIDDLEYARAYLRERLGRQAVGARALRAKLTTRGIPPAVADAAIEELSRGADGDASRVASELDRALVALRQIARRYAAVEPRERRRRLAAALARRGFDWETIEGALRELDSEKPI